MYQLQIRNCKGEAGSVRLPDSKAYDTFATFSDLLLLGEDLRADIPNATAGAHYDNVALIYTDDLSQQRMLVSSVFLLCECKVKITDERASSQLYTPRSAA